MISDERVMELAEESLLAYQPGWVHNPGQPTKPRAELRRFVDLVCKEFKAETKAKP